MGALRDALTHAPQFLSRGGIMAVISFHSTEDRMVKYLFRDLCDKDDTEEKSFQLMFKKPVIASEEEMLRNPRARSAKLRAIKRIT
jgi:16S rRNA (cytosine1402-N4)-methyltransferase